MKKLVLIAALLVGGLVTTQAQTVTNGIPNFLEQVQFWAFNVNTNYDWSNAVVEVESGYKQVAGSGAASFIGVQYDIGRWNARVEGQFFGVGSSFNGVEAGGGYALYKKNDFKVEAELLGGYDRNRAAWLVEPGIRAVKMLTVNTYTTASYSFPVFSKGQFDSTGQVKIGLGFFF